MCLFPSSFLHFFLTCHSSPTFLILKLSITSLFILECHFGICGCNKVDETDKNRHGDKCGLSTGPSQTALLSNISQLDQSLTKGGFQDDYRADKTGINIPMWSIHFNRNGKNAHRYCLGLPQFVPLFTIWRKE